MNNTQKEIQDRLERGENPEYISEIMGIPLSYIILKK